MTDNSPLLEDVSRAVAEGRRVRDHGPYKVLI